MSNNIYIYIFVMAGVTYLIRLLPLTFIRREIKNTFIRARKTIEKSGITPPSHPQTKHSPA